MFLWALPGMKWLPFLCVYTSSVHCLWVKKSFLISNIALPLRIPCCKIFVPLLLRGSIYDLTPHLLSVSPHLLSVSPQLCMHNSTLHFGIIKGHKNKLRATPISSSLHWQNGSEKSIWCFVFQSLPLSDQYLHPVYLWLIFVLLFYFPRHVADTFQLFCHLLTASLCP